MIKKYGIGILAFVLAIAASSFTIIKKYSPNALYTFQYSGPSATTVNDVINESNYTFIGMDQPACSGLQQKACRVNVPATYVSGTTLLTTANISATIANGTKAEINGIATGGNYSNQAEP